MKRAINAAEPPKVGPKGEFSMSENDAKLLSELGFYNTARADSVLGTLTMRQLDKLKMMFMRISALNVRLFPGPIELGIRNNDLGCYSEAIHLLLHLNSEAADQQVPSEEEASSIHGHTHKIK